jgi:hypothetical protein
MVELTNEEKSLPYVKYFYRDLAPISEEKLRIRDGAPAPAEMAMPIEKRNLFLEKDSEYLSTGFCVAPNGTGFVANTQFMPGVTVDMFKWWFGWHCVGPDLRYKLWDHDDHYYARANNKAYILDPAVPMEEKSWGIDHEILEDIGLGADPLVISFKKPSDMGFDMSKIGTDSCAAIVCGIGKSSSPAFMAHKVMRAEGGITMVSRFWMGYSMDDNGNIIKLIPDGQSIPEIGPRALFGHCIKEYTNWASFIAELYAEEGPEISE